jgi:hypothetical protein
MAFRRLTALHFRISSRAALVVSRADEALLHG